MPDEIQGLFSYLQPGEGAGNYIEGSETKPGLNQLVKSINASLEYLKFFVGSTLDEPSLSMVSSGGIITVSVQKAGGGDIRYRTDVSTETLVCDPVPQTVDLTPGTDSTPVTNYVYIDHSINDVVVNTTGFPETPHSSLAEYYVRSALFHETNGLLGKNHKNHVFSPGDNGHMEHINEARRKQPCVFKNGLLLTATGSGTATVNFALSSGQLHRMHSHDVSGLSSPANFFINNHETTPDLVRSNFHQVSTHSDGSTNLNEYCVYIFFIAHLDDTTGLFLLKPSGGYNAVTDAYTDPDATANWSIPAPYIGASIYVARVIARRTASTTTIYDINTDIRGLTPSAVAGGGLSGVPSHGASHLSNDPIPATTASFLAASEAGSFEEKNITESKTLLSIQNVDNTSDLDKPVSTATQTAIDNLRIVGCKVVNYSPTVNQELTTTYAAIDGSTIAYTPKRSDSVIKYTFNYAFTSNETDGDSLSHIKLQSNSTGSWIDVSGKKRNIWSNHNEPEDFRTIIFSIPSWGTSPASLRLLGRAYNVDDQQIMHEIKTWDGVNSTELVDATVEIIEMQA